MRGGDRTELAQTWAHMIVCRGTQRAPVCDTPMHWGATLLLCQNHTPCVSDIHRALDYTSCKGTSRKKTVCDLCCGGVSLGTISWVGYALWWVPLPRTTSHAWADFNEEQLLHGGEHAAPRVSRARFGRISQ